MSEPLLPELSENTDTDSTGNQPDVSEGNLLTANRVITSASQVFDISENLVVNWEKAIKNAAKITAKLNGDRPYNSRTLANQGKAWKTNISTGFLATECGKVPPRFYMPILQAKHLTAAQLPVGWPNGVEKTEFFRTELTRAIRSWKKWPFFIRGLSREVAVFGLGYSAFFDSYEWRPSLIRMDKGFVPTGTEIMDGQIPFFCVKWDYKPGDLLRLLRLNKEAGLKDWDESATVKSINDAAPIPSSSDESDSRTYEELIRQSVESYSYAKDAKLVQCYHLFATEMDGRVSHYIIDINSKELLYTKEDAYASMEDVCVPMVFDYGDGTLQGAWGAGQILYDMAVQVEKVRNDSLDNLRNQNKLKIQVQDAKDVNTVKLVVNDTMMIVSGGQFNGAAAALPQNVDAYITLDGQLTRIAQEKIGAFVPPIPLSPSDIKAAQVNAAMMKEQELQQALLDNWLMQVAQLINAMTRRLTRADNPDDTAKKLRTTLLEKLTEEEIELLVNQPTVQTITEFTPFMAQQRAMFASSKTNNPLYNQRSLELVQAEAAGGLQFAEGVLLPEGDQSVMLEAQRQQTLENAALAQMMPVPVLPQDNDWVHAQVMEPFFGPLIQSGNIQVAQLGLQHYAAHYAQGVAKKTWPKEMINKTKQMIAQLEKAIADAQGQQQQQQQPTV